MKRFWAAMLLCMLMIASAGAVQAEDGVPYVFLFIGDGMGINHAAAAAYTRLALDEDATYAGTSFLTFDTIGLMTTHSLTGSVTDSAASATAMASGVKTLNGALNCNPETGDAYTPLCYQMKENGYGIGLITSVSADHATPAAFYASAGSRYDYLDIARQGLAGGLIDFWGAGGFSAKSEDKAALEALLEASPYTLAKTPEAIRALTAESLPILALAEDDVADPYMAYELDRRRTAKYGGDTVSLADMVDKAIETLAPGGSFFIMCEGGKIDTCSSSLDMAGMVYEVFALEDAVERAMAFAQAHPEETLIVVLADHETGGIRIRQDANWAAITLQKASYARFSSIASGLYRDGADSAAYLDAVAHYFTLSQDENLSDAELDALVAAFETGRKGSDMTESEVALYEGLRPAAYVPCNLVESRMRVAFETAGHTGQPVPVYATGQGSALFAGVYDNTDIHAKLSEAMRLQ